MEKRIIIKPSFVFKDYFKTNLYLYIFRPYFIIIIIALMFIGLKFYNAMIFENQINNIIFPLVSILFIFLFLFFLIYKQTKKMLSNYRLKESFSYIITDDFIEEKGDSFQIKHFWKHFKKIIEKDNLFLLYVNNNQAIIIRKHDLKDNQYNELKDLFNTVDIKKSLQNQK